MLGTQGATYWTRAVQFACLLCNVPYATAPTHKLTPGALDSLLALALSSFGGNYNQGLHIDLVMKRASN